MESSQITTTMETTTPEPNIDMMDTMDTSQSNTEIPNQVLSPPTSENHTTLPSQATSQLSNDTTIDPDNGDDDGDDI